MKKPDKKLIILFVVVFVVAGIFIVDRVVLKDQEESTLVVQSSGFEDSLEVDTKVAHTQRAKSYTEQYNSEKIAASEERNRRDDDELFEDEVITPASDQTAEKTTADGKTNDLDIHQPATITTKSQKKASTPVERVAVSAPTVLEKKVKQEDEPTEPVRRKVGFSSSENRSNSIKPTGAFVPIQVVVQDDVAIAQGTSIFMRTTEEVTLGNCTFPQNTLVKGVASVNQNILFIDVAVISYQGCTVSKKLTAHSVDGNRGLVIQGGTENQIRNEAVNDVLNTAQQVVSSPLLRNLPFRASKRAVNNQEVNISKGHTLILMEQ